MATTNVVIVALKVGLVLGGLTLIGFLTYEASKVLIMSLIGIGVGTLVSPLFTTMRDKYKIPRALSALILLVLLILFGIAVFFAIGHLVADQVNTLSTRAPQLINNLQNQLQQLFDRYPWVQERIQSVNLEESITAVLSELIRGVRSGFTLISGLVFAGVVALYTAVGAKEYTKSFVNLFPASRRSRVTDVLGHCAQSLRRWFRVQLIDMAIIGLLTLIGLWIAGIEYWAVFGLLTAIFGLVPYLGILIVVVVACLITLASNPSDVPWVLVVFIVTQQIEGNLILPRVMKEHLELPEMPLLIFMLFMGTWFGLLGIFLATPSFAILRTLHLELYRPRVDEN